MNKILLIIQREYLSRVKKKSFIVLTILVPMLFMGMFAMIGYLAVKGDDLGDVKKVQVIDESGEFTNKLVSSKSVVYVFNNENFDTARKKFIENGYTFLLHIPPASSPAPIELLSDKKPSATTIETVETALSNIAEARRLKAAGIDTAVLAQAQKRIEIKAKQITDTGEKDAQTYTAYAIGFLSAFLIYICLFIYGTQVMRGVIEEKVSRIVEVVISSVRPFQLMMGKIIGVGLVGLTQFALWIIISVTLSTVGGSLMANKMSHRVEQVTSASNVKAVKKVQTPESSMSIIKESIENIPITYTVSCFLFYFLFGYMLYSAVFAAAGSAADNETETQQFTIPVTLPLIFTFALAQSFIINNPDSSLSVWLSMIPFTSPIAMMIRIPFGVPAWQLGLSMLLLILGFMFTTWMAGRIYRVGILMYGKKASYKELVKWFMYKE
ncbi:MAG: ABC transporter permease [Taibaiella sp.]|nr:ABC transporter permease [Taibaiella sp.]